MTENAIERLKNRQRKKVSPRNASLNVNIETETITESSQTTNTSNNNDVITKNSQKAKESDINGLEIKSSQTINQLNSNDVITKNSQIVEPVRRTVRLDPQVDEYMDVLCKENRVTRETLIEAAILICSKNQKTLNKVITDAKDRYKDRKHKGELKKLQTMSRKLTGS